MIKWNESNLSKIDKDLLKALNKTAVDVLTDITIAGVVPFDIGTLESTADVSKASNTKGVASIRWITPYASKLYFHPEYNFQNGRKGKWADAWINGSKRKFILSTFKKNARR